MYLHTQEVNYLLAHDTQKGSHMMHSTPEERGCQAPVGTNGTPEDWSRHTETTNKPLPPLHQKIQEGLTTSDLNAIVQEIGKKPLVTPVSKVIEACNQPNESPAKQKSIEESRKLLDTFNDKLKNYPKHLTYEGSVVLCVMVSINEGKEINISGMPQVDRDLILSQLPADATSKMAKHEAYLSVEFDELKDFVLVYGGNGTSPVKLHFFNAVIHPQKLPDTNVPVEKDGGKVTVGTAVVLDQKRIQKLIGVVPQEKIHREEEDEFPRRQPAANRNAYEIRADVLQMAIDWTEKRDEYGKKDETDVLNLAKKFYEFVEDRRRR